VRDAIFKNGYSCYIDGIELHCDINVMYIPNTTLKGRNCFGR